MLSRRIKLVLVAGSVFGLALLCQKLASVRPHFFARCVVLYGMPGSRQAMDVTGIVVSPDNRFVAAWAQSPDPMDAGSLPEQFWDVASRKLLPPRKPLPGFTTGYDWFNHGELHGIHKTRTGITGIADENGFSVVDTKTKKIIRHLNYPVQLYESNPIAWTFSPDGKTLWWAGEQQRIFWQSID